MYEISEIAFTFPLICRVHSLKSFAILYQIQHDSIPPSPFQKILKISKTLKQLIINRLETHPRSSQRSIYPLHLHVSIYAPPLVHHPICYRLDTTPSTSQSLFSMLKSIDRRPICSLSLHRNSIDCSSRISHRRYYILQVAPSATLQIMSSHS